MQDLSYLDDPDAQAAILRIAEEAARRFRPGEAQMAQDVAAECLGEVRAAGQLLYPQPAHGRGVKLDEFSLWLLFALPVIVGCLGNLMAVAGVRAFETWRAWVIARNAPPAELFSANRIRPALAAHARAAGLTEADVERLVLVIGAVLIALLTETKAGGQP